MPATAATAGMFRMFAVTMSASWTRGSAPSIFKECGGSKSHELHDLHDFLRESRGVRPDDDGRGGARVEERQRRAIGMGGV